MPSHADIINVKKLEPNLFVNYGILVQSNFIVSYLKTEGIKWFIFAVVNQETMLIPVARNIFRWRSNDPELGIDQYGTMLLKGDLIVIVDPPMVPGLVEAIRILGKPEAVIMTNFAHSRGSNAMARHLGIPLYIPEIKDKDGRENEEEIRFLHLDRAIRYNEGTKLPLGIKAHHLRPKTDSGDVVFDEMELQFENFLVLGDSAWGINGKINYFPAGIMPDEGRKKETANRIALEKLLKETGSRGLISGHGEVVTGLSR